jgi:hypothetical protein
MDLIKRLFGAGDERNAAGVSRTMVEPVHGAQDFEAQLHTRCELVRVRTRNTLRLSGIPEFWIEPQVLLEPEGGRTFLHLRLVVRHWDERLLRYAVALQNKLMTEIERIDPQARQWLRSIVWNFPPEIHCPYAELPQPSVWVDAKAPDRSPEPEPDEVQSDLARLFAVRDAEMSQSDAGGRARGD